MAAIVLGLACGDDDATAPTYQFSVSATPEALTIVQDDSVIVHAAVTNLTLNRPVPGIVVPFISLDTIIATVARRDVTFKDAAGKDSVATKFFIFGRNAGTAKIRATYLGGEDTIQVTVTPRAVASVVLTPATATLFTPAPSDTRTFTAVLRDASGATITRRRATFMIAIEDTAFASVSSTGTATAKLPGTARLIAFFTNTGPDVSTKADTSLITITLRPVATVTVTPNPVAVRVGSTVQLTATTRAANGSIFSDRLVTWTSSDPLIAGVDGTGKVTGVSQGTVTITATSEGRSGTATVSVVP